jgi:hypothetical protein
MCAQTAGQAPKNASNGCPRATLQWLTMSIITVGLNELMLHLLPPRLIGFAWALLCLWVLFDSTLVGTRVRDLEASATIQEARCTALETQNMHLCRTILFSNDNHLILCEIRQRVILQGQRARQPHHSPLTLRARSHPNFAKDVVATFATEPTKIGKGS